MEISYLADHVDYLAIIARWLHAEWGWFTPGSTLESRYTALEQHLNRDRLPLAIVAHEEGRPIGTASLRTHDMDTRQNFTPWLARVYVIPQVRTRGRGTRLVAGIEAEAQRLGFERLYLVTFDKASYYTKRGWAELERTHYREKPVNLMHKVLLPTTTSGPFTSTPSRWRLSTHAIT